jgi:hypothetical protein
MASDRVLTRSLVSERGGRAGRDRAGQQATEPRADPRAEHRTAGGDGADRPDDLGVVRVLEQVTPHAGVHRGIQRGVQVLPGEHEYRHGGGGLAHLFDPGETTQLRVHHHDIRLAGHGFPHDIGAVTDLADHGDVGLGVEHGAQAVSQHGLVIAQHH